MIIETAACFFFVGIRPLGIEGIGERCAGARNIVSGDRKNSRGKRAEDGNHSKLVHGILLSADRVGTGMVRLCEVTILLIS